MKVIRNTWQTWQCGKFLPLTHSVAQANAIRCDGKVNAFRWLMQCIDFADAMLERCHVCKGKDHVIFDEVIGESRETNDADRFTEVEKIEAMSPEEKFEFFKNELSKCIRCNACRNVCPACSCRKCVFDSTKFDIAQ